MIPKEFRRDCYDYDTEDEDEGPADV
jgi:hypothetical protein